MNELPDHDKQQIEKFFFDFKERAEDYFGTIEAHFGRPIRLIAERVCEVIDDEATLVGLVNHSGAPKPLVTFVAHRCADNMAKLMRVAVWSHLPETLEEEEKEKRLAEISRLVTLIVKVENEAKDAVADVIIKNIEKDKP